MAAEILYSLPAGVITAGNAPKQETIFRQHVNRYLPGLIMVVLLNFINSCLHLFLTLIIGDFFIIRFNSSSSKGRLLQMFGIEVHSVNSFFLLFAGLLILKFISGGVARFMSVWQGELLVKNFRETLFKAQLQTSAELFQKKSFGNYLLRYSNDMKAVQSYLTKGLLVAINEILFLMAATAIIWMIHPVLAAIAAFFICTALAFVRSISLVQKKLIADSRSKRSNLLAFVAKTFSRFGRMKENEAEEKMSLRFSEKSVNLLTANIHNEKMESMIRAITDITPFVIIGSVLLLITFDIVTVTASKGLSTILILLLMQGSLKRLLNVPLFINKGKISLDKMALSVGNK